MSDIEQFDLTTSSDPVDQSSNEELLFTDMAVKAQMEAAKPQRGYEEGEEYECEDCGCSMPLYRAQQGYMLCIDCQVYSDRVNKVRKIRGEM